MEQLVQDPNWMESALAVIVGIGLAASCGFRVFVPLLVVSGAANAGYLDVAENLRWLASPAAMIAFAVASVVEIGAYYVPWLDNLLDAIASPLSVVAGAILFAASVTRVRSVLAVVAGDHCGGRGGGGGAGRDGGRATGVDGDDGRAGEFCRQHGGDVFWRRRFRCWRSWCRWWRWCCCWWWSRGCITWGGGWWVRYWRASGWGGAIVHARMSTVTFGSIHWQEVHDGDFDGAGEGVVQRGGAGAGEGEHTSKRLDRIRRRG